MQPEYLVNQSSPATPGSLQGDEGFDTVLTGHSQFGTVSLRPPLWALKVFGLTQEIQVQFKKLTKGQKKWLKRNRLVQKILDDNPRLTRFEALQKANKILGFPDESPPPPPTTKRDKPDKRLLPGYVDPKTARKEANRKRREEEARVQRRAKP